MADYIATARSNYFRVKDFGAFKEAMAPLDIEVRNSGGRAVIFSSTEFGDWPWQYYDEEAEDYVDLDFTAIVADHLEDGEVAIFMEAGAEKLRYIVGFAVAINNRHERIRISLDDIYDRAQALGTSITPAEYWRDNTTKGA